MPADHVRQQLARILRHELFARADVHARFLKIVVEETLAGTPPKAPFLLMGVFLEPKRNKKKVDSDEEAKVRVEAGRLRNRLAEYYVGPGATDPVIIEIPKGGYSATFVFKPTPGHESRITNSFKSFQFVLIGCVAVLLLTLILLYAVRSLIKTPNHQSLAVLAVSNPAGNKDLDFLCDGITDALTNRLSVLPQLRIISKDSVDRLNSPTNVKAAGSELHVTYVLSSSLALYDDNAYLRAELIQVNTNSHVWSHEYRRPRSEIAGIEIDVSQDIARALKLRLDAATKRMLTFGVPSTSDAYSLYLQGLHESNKRTPDGLNEAVKLFQMSIKSDPNYSVAYAALANAHALLGIYGLDSSNNTMPEAKRLALHALQLDPALPAAYVALADVEDGYEWNWVAARTHYEKAIDLDPSDALARDWYALDLACFGKQSEAIRQLREAAELNPLSPTVRMHLGWIYYFFHRYDEAIKEYNQALKLQPSFTAARWRLGLAYEQKGMLREAEEELLRATKEVPEDSQIRAMLARCYQLSNRPDKAQEILIELLSHANTRYVSPFSIATTYLVLGNDHLAIQWLERSYVARDSWLVYLGVDPIFDPIRSQPQFRALESRIGLTHNNGS